MLSLMAKEAAKRETGKGSSEYRDRAVIMAMEAAKQQMKEVKETGRGRGSEYNRGRTVIRSRGRGRAIITAVKAEAERQKQQRQRHNYYCKETTIIPRIDVPTW